MARHTFIVTQTVRLYPGVQSTWHYVLVPKEVSNEIYTRYRAQVRGFGSLPVIVVLGESEWHTSLFRDTRAERYLLFLKKAVRQAESVMEGDEVSVQITLDLGV